MGVHYFHTGPWPVFIGFTMSADDFGREMKRLKVPSPPQFLAHDNAGATTHVFVSRGALTLIIALGTVNARTREQVAALIAHEAMHVVQAMQEELASGKSLGSEAEAYLIQMIVQECLQIAWKSKKRRSTKP